MTSNYVEKSCLKQLVQIHKQNRNDNNAAVFLLTLSNKYLNILFYFELNYKIFVPTMLFTPKTHTKY